VEGGNKAVDPRKALNSEKGDTRIRKIPSSQLWLIIDIPHQASLQAVCPRCNMKRANKL
jgi:hypothetical protein